MDSKKLLTSSNLEGEIFTLDTETKETCGKGAGRIFVSFNDEGQSIIFQDEKMKSIIILLAQENYDGMWVVKEPFSGTIIRTLII